MRKCLPACCSCSPFLTFVSNAVEFVARLKLNLMLLTELVCRLFSVQVTCCISPRINWPNTFVNIEKQHRRLLVIKIVSVSAPNALGIKDMCYLCIADPVPP